MGVFAFHVHMCADPVDCPPIYQYGMHDFNASLKHLSQPLNSRGSDYEGNVTCLPKIQHSVHLQWQLHFAGNAQWNGKHFYQTNDFNMTPQKGSTTGNNAPAAPPPNKLNKREHNYEQKKRAWETSLLFTVASFKLHTTVDSCPKGVILIYPSSPCCCFLINWCQPPYTIYSPYPVESNLYPEEVMPSGIRIAKMKIEAMIHIEQFISKMFN